MTALELASNLGMALVLLVSGVGTRSAWLTGAAALVVLATAVSA